MPVKRRWAPRWFVLALAIPVIATVYLAVAGRRVFALGRSMLVGFLAISVIGSVYAEVAARTAVTPARRQPLPLTIAMALALAVMGSGLPNAPVRAAESDADSVVKAALHYLGAPYVLGTEGPTTFDCSGLVYRAFKDAAQLPLISGRRLTASGYYTYFTSRGMSSKTNGHRGDLVAYGKNGDIRHIGIYLGDGKVVSALTQGVTIHGINALVYNSFVAFLNVPWGTTPTDATATSTDQVTTTAFVNAVPKSTNSGSGSNSSGQPAPAASDVIGHGYAVGSLNVRDNAGPNANIISWVTRGQTVDILASGHSDGGALWYQIRKPSGKEGWVWSGWMKVVDGQVGG